MSLAPGAGALGEAVCHQCGGRLLDEAAVERVIVLEHGIARPTLRELAGHFGRPRLPCPACRLRMHPVRLRAIDLELCTGCGAVWLDAGELARLSEGRWDEVAGPVPPAQLAPAAPLAVAAEALADSAERTVLLETDEVDAERLVEAFQRARFRAAQDARFAAQRGHGVVAERIPLEEARALAAALAVAGLSARLVEPAKVALPRAVRTKELSVDDAGLTCTDALHRPQRLSWESIRVLGVGLVRLTDLERQEEPGQPSDNASPDAPPALLRRRRTVLVERDDALLEILGVDAQGERWRVRATRDGMVFRQRGGQSADAAFRTLLRQVIARAPASAALTRGARTLGDDRAPWMRYRALHDFEAALRWTLAHALDLPRSPP